MLLQLKKYGFRKQLDKRHYNGNQDSRKQKNFTERKKYYSRRRIIQFFGQLMKVGLQIMKNVFTPLAKNFLMSLGLMDAVAGTDAAISKKVFG